MFHEVRNTDKYGIPDPRTVATDVQKRLPEGWSVRAHALNTKGKNAVLELRPASGERARLLITRCRRVVPRDLLRIVEAAATKGVPILLLAPFLSPRAREVLVQLGASYADATGNLRLELDRPAVFIETQGADRNPNRESRSLKSLKGAAAGRVVRALCDFKPPFGVRALAEASSTPLGTVSRVVTLVEEEALLERGKRKEIARVNWDGLLRRWSQDYDVKTSNTLQSFIEPRGLSVLRDKLKATARRYAATGSLAAPRIAPTRLASVYVDDRVAAADEWGLVPTDTGMNVWLLEPYDEVVFERTHRPGFATGAGEDGLLCAGPTQVAVDLMTGPGRSPQEGEALIKKMKEDEDGWRRPL